MSVQANSYRNVADVLHQLPGMVADMRAIYGLTQAAAAAQIGVSKTALCRFEQGGSCHLRNAVLMLRWLDDMCPSDVRVQPAAVAA